MANIGATTAFYKVETSLTRANNEVSKSMERLATGKANANAGDRSSYVAMADTFRLDFVGTKAGIKGANVVMGYLETAMRTLDSASGLLSRLQELAVLGANQTNTAEDALAIDTEAEAIADEFHRLLDNAKYKGKPLFVASANSEYLSLGGRNSNMTFGVQKIAYTELYVHDYETYYNENALTGASDAQDRVLKAKIDLKTKEVVKGLDYEIYTPGGDTNTDNFVDDPTDRAHMATLGITGADPENGVTGKTDTGYKFANAAASLTLNLMEVVKQENQLVFTASEGANSTTNSLTSRIENVQAKINTARVQAGSQYAALESAVNYITDLTAQY